jgi:dihydroorotase
MPETLRLRYPDDWHVHFRDGDVLQDVVADTARYFRRAIVMPNLVPPIITTAQAGNYRARILAALPTGMQFEPLMVLYLTEATDPSDIQTAKASGYVHGVKLYPAGATTNSQQGVRNIAKVYPVLEMMAAVGLPLLIHGEVVTPDIDVFDREKVFIETILIPLIERFPTLNVVLEHITTQEAVSFVQDAPATVAATITAHHLLLNRNALFIGGIRPHHYCLPVLKREIHRLALVSAATRGNPKFFLGTDSAPHARPTKEAACGCAGIYTAHCALELYAEVFEQADALDKLENFASGYGADFYGLPRNTDYLTLEKTPWTIPTTKTFGTQSLVPFRAGETVAWQVRCPVVC